MTGDSSEDDTQQAQNRDTSRTHPAWTDDAIATYLFFGYLPRWSQEELDAKPWAQFRKDPTLERAKHQQVVDLGVDTLRTSFEEVDDRPHVVPLSGGLDSRAILAELCRRIDPSSLTTVTVGTPGTFDFDIAGSVAEAAGVSHMPIDLTAVDLARDHLVRTALLNGAPTWVFDAHYNRLIRRRLGSDALYWSGYLGGHIVSNEHLPEYSENWKSTTSTFVQRNRWATSTQLWPSGFDPASVVPHKQLHPDTDLSPYEQLDLSIRQECLVRTVNLPQGYEHKAPFTHLDWVQYALSLPHSEKLGQRAYRDILLTSHPRLFALPTKNRYGLPLNASRRHLIAWHLARIPRGLMRRLSGASGWTKTINYIDFSDALRSREDVRSLVEKSLKLLKERRVLPWLDLEGLWQEHMDEKAERTKALTLLASLEVHLAAAEEGSGAKFEDGSEQSGDSPY